MEKMKEYDINSLTKEDLAELLTAAGVQVDVLAEIEKDIQSGCPLNEDGTLNLTEYIAWLAPRV